MENRKRNNRMWFRVTDQEQAAIHERMEFIGMTNQEAFLRTMALKGLVIRHDFTDVREMVRLLRVTSNSLNQLTKRVHETGNIYAVDIQGLRESYEKLWNLAEETLQVISQL